MDDLDSLRRQIELLKLENKDLRRRSSLTVSRGADEDVLHHREKTAVEDKRRMQAQLFQAQKLEAIGTLAGGIAHDFNNILMSIQGHISMLKTELKPAHAQYRRLQQMEDQIVNGSHLTRQLVGFAGGGKYEVKQVDLNDLVRKSADMFGRTRKELFIGRKLQDPLWNVMADQSQIEQVLLNLYINAWQAMSEGGDLDIATTNVVLPEAEARANDVPAGRYVMVSVKDTGVGMNQETQDRIFDPFFTTKGPGKETGLGLSSAYGIVRNHGGFISVQSELGLGSTFCVFLPAAEEEKANNALDKGGGGTREEILTGEGTILLVDDEQMVIEVTKEVLEHMGYRVITACSGQEAVAVFREKKDSIDLVILDKIMPGMGGGKAFEAIRAIDPQVKVIMSSGYCADTEVQQLLAQGCCGFMQKPHRMQELSQKIREALGNINSGEKGRKI